MRLTVVTALAVVFLGLAPASAEPLDSNSIVFIRCTGPEGQITEGTGVVISTRGHVITARHVARERYSCAGSRGGRSETPPHRLAHTALPSSRYDYVILAFAGSHDAPFRPVDPAESTEALTGATLAVLGFPADGPASPSRRTGTVSNAERDADGMMESFTITSPGMSGGPAFSGGKLVAIVAGARFDDLGLVSNYALLAAEAFAEDIRRVRAEAEETARSESASEIARLLAQDSVCNALLRRALRGRNLDGLTLPEEPDLPPSKLLDVAEHWVTITTGPALWLDCKADSPRKSIFFPMGLVLRPLHDLTIRDASGAYVEWTMFQTDYGLSVLIDRSATAPVTPDVGYVFAVGNGVYKVCGPRDGEVCDPGENLPPFNNNSARWPYISGWDSYLRTENPAGLETAYAEYLDFRENRDKVEAKHPDILKRGFVQRLPRTLDEDPACAVQEAQLHLFQMQHDAFAPNGNAVYAEPVRFSFCYIPPPGSPSQTAGYRPIKVVTAALAEKMFELLWFAEVRLSPTPVVLELDVFVSEDREPFVELVECNSPDDESGATSRRVRLYQPWEGNSHSEVLAKAPLLQKISLEMECGENDRPVRARQIKITFEQVFDWPVKLDMAAIEETYNENFQSHGYDERRYLQNGFVERICDYPEYQSWLDVLRSELIHEPEIVLGENRLGVSKERVADHFAHLILATMFFTDVELQTQESPFGGCDD